MTLDSVSIDQSGKGDGRTDPSVTLVAFCTDATTVLERLALHGIKKAGSSGQAELLVKIGTVMMTRDEAVARSRRKQAGLCGRVKRNCKLCLTGSGLEGVCW